MCVRVCVFMCAHTHPYQERVSGEFERGRTNQKVTRLVGTKTRSVVGTRWVEEKTGRIKYKNRDKDSVRKFKVHRRKESKRSDL